jgi:hypothetical protein
MDFDVLPGPSLPELARTALARAAAATVSDTDPAGRPVADAEHHHRRRPVSELAPRGVAVATHPY